MSQVTVQQAIEVAFEHHRAGRLPEAEALYREVLAAEPHHAEAWHLLGLIAAQKGRHDLAVEWMSRAIAIRPNHATARANLGESYRNQGRLDEALAQFYMALELQPNSPEACNNLGGTLAAKGRVEEAEAAYERALALRPNYPKAFSNLGIVLTEQGRFDEAAACHERALACEPHFAEAHLNLGVVRRLMGRFAEAEACYRRALVCRPDYPDAHLNLSLLLLLLGRFEEGWGEYEWRGRSTVYAGSQRHFFAPRWDGRPVPGKTVLIHAEQGFGDLLLGLRYLPFLRAQSGAARVVLECQRELVSLLAPLRSEWLEIVARETPDGSLPAFDLHLPLLSLPLALQMFAALPPMAPALRADSVIRAKWRERLGEGKGLKVGLVWAGNPGQGDDRRRSIAPAKLAPLLEVPGVRVFSMQRGAGDEGAAELAARGLRDFREQLTDFSQTAALMAELDLIITVDTATAHLAGTLGKPVWVMLPFVPYWPYGLGREDTPWYPTMRLFRQTVPGDWEGVMERIALALRERCVGGD